MLCPSPYSGVFRTKLVAQSVSTPVYTLSILSSSCSCHGALDPSEGLLIDFRSHSEAMARLRQPGLALSRLGRKPSSHNHSACRQCLLLCRQRQRRCRCTSDVGACSPCASLGRTRSHCCTKSSISRCEFFESSINAGQLLLCEGYTTCIRHWQS